ncbi:hypothetical protein LTR86_004521 [Recurvomyces mirabilis]|nr:hypothetical protein LTR86_004521 [Recurvomyces mirabilis]
MFAIPIVRASTGSKEAECKPTADADANSNSEDTATTGLASPDLTSAPVAKYIHSPQIPRQSKWALKLNKLQTTSPRQRRSPPLETSPRRSRERWRKWRISNEIDVKLRAMRARVHVELADMSPALGDVGAVDTSLSAYRRNQRRRRKVQGIRWPSPPLQTEFEEDVVDEAYRTMSPREKRTFRRGFDYDPAEYVFIPKAETLNKAQRLGEEFLRKREASELEGDDEAYGVTSTSPLPNENLTEFEMEDCGALEGSVDEGSLCELQDEERVFDDRSGHETRTTSTLPPASEDMHILNDDEHGVL